MGDRGDLLAGTALHHDSAEKHVVGGAIYIDDIPEPQGILHVALGLSERAHARILKPRPARTIRTALPGCNDDPRRAFVAAATPDRAVFSS